MPKITSFISSAEIGQEYTVVNSGAYGRHVRAKRGTHKPIVVTDAMKKAGALMRSANGHAKVIFDAFKPYCKNIKDGKLWSRLVAAFRKQLQYDDLDLHAVFLRFYFHRRRPLSGVLFHNLEVIQPEGKEKSIVVKVSSKSAVKPGRHDPDHYEQIVIAVFLDADFRATVLSDAKLHPVSRDKRNEHVVTFPYPEGARTAIIALKCNHQYQGKECAGVLCGMSVVKIVS